MTVLPEMSGKAFLVSSHHVASSLGSDPPLVGAEPELEPPEDPPLDADEEPEFGAAGELSLPEPVPAELDEAVSEELEDTLDALELLEPPLLSLPPQAVRISATAPIPAMLAIALLADVRDTRLTSLPGHEPL
ncbi:hypothetical protein GCM10011594_30550 [Nakamurella endophytica]|uniref:Uncharacterized protein n=1 Tax=Nakamurella endophytica TaxID=1748367 RepID=A0A917T456_9ACTN|nr:hypothetical protein GCM10011594_30550 [Nakamurella endophytica]